MSCHGVAVVAQKHSTMPTHACAEHMAAETLTGISFAATGDLRLVGGATSEDGSGQFGRLEVFNKGGWGTVCNAFGSGFARSTGPRATTSASINVACQQLGFMEGATTEIAVCFRCACTAKVEHATPSGCCYV